MSAATSAEKRQELGQFLTPAPIASFMASLFQRQPRDVKLLDAGAGAGALSAMLVRRWCKTKQPPHSISVTAYELDSELIPALEHAYAECETECLRAGIAFQAEIVNADFIEAVLPLLHRDLFALPQTPFNVAILNPPYRKIQSDSAARRMGWIQNRMLQVG